MSDWKQDLKFGDNCQSGNKWMMRIQKEYRLAEVIEKKNTILLFRVYIDKDVTKDIGFTRNAFKNARVGETLLTKYEYDNKNWIQECQQIADSFVW